VNTRDKLDDKLDAGPVELVRAALLDLATYGTPEAIARRLFRLGLTGRRGLCGECPLYWFLTMRAGRDVFVAGGTAAVYVEGQGWVDVALPEVVQAFVDYFDGGQFPWLDRTAPERTTAPPPRWTP
jgi:hypothetical protein